jgi:glutamyl-tRNA synthetase
MPSVNKILKEVNSLSIDEQEKEFVKLEKLVGHRKVREGLPELPNAKKGKVIMRMSPSPSGALTLGHILTILPNFLYVQKYGGKFYIRIEDTNPENIYKPAYKMIEEESKWLCKNKVKIIIQSKRMNLYYKYAEKLIDKGFAYVCECGKEEFKEFILKKKACSCRSLDKKQQKERWKKMLDEKGYKQGQAVLRFKSNMKDNNPAMRDFPLARINTKKHPLQGNKYKVWPLMNLAVTIDDIEQGMTHIIRGKDHMDNAKRQKMLYIALGIEKQYPWIAFIGRLHFSDFEMSASKIRKAIESGKYKGWSDKRLPTASSLKKQGYKPEAFYKFVEQRGISEVDKVISKKDFFEVLEQFNK